MLSYRHAFHAGNHADVLKHLTQLLILEYLIQKPGKPLCYIDTHAGPGAYSLTQGFATQNQEYKTGISKLWTAKNLPEPLHKYVELIKHMNAGSNCHFYPGSPAIAQAVLRPIDKLRLYEMHPSDSERLTQWGRGDRRVHIERSDGFKGLIASVPPPEKRGLVLIDPPYEVKNDYLTVVNTVVEAFKRFSTGTYLIWYPLLDRADAVRMVEKLRRKPWRFLNAELHVKPKQSGGMVGSGVFVINPPWHLQAQLQASLPVLQTLLAEEHAANFLLLAQDENKTG